MWAFYRPFKTLLENIAKRSETESISAGVAGIFSVALRERVQTEKPNTPEETTALATDTLQLLEDLRRLSPMEKDVLEKVVQAGSEGYAARSTDSIVNALRNDMIHATLERLAQLNLVRKNANGRYTADPFVALL